MQYFIDKWNWERINYPLLKDDLKRFHKSNVTIAVNVLCTKKEKNIFCYVSKT